MVLKKCIFIENVKYVLKLCKNMLYWNSALASDQTFPIHTFTNVQSK